MFFIKTFDLIEFKKIDVRLWPEFKMKLMGSGSGWELFMH